MALKENAEYRFSVCFLRVTPLNDDLSQPVTTLIGGAGPFDFSGVADDTQVPLITKIDATAAETVLVDVSEATGGVTDVSAVTVDELFASINTASPTSVTASKDGTTGRLVLTFASGTVIQAYGECAEIGMIGQGKGVRVVSTDTMKSFTETPIVKDEETFTTTDANGIDTEIVTDGYRKGVSGSFVDSATDFLLRTYFEGGVINATTGAYSVPTSEDNKIYFRIEVFSAKYLMGTNKQFDIDSYEQTLIYSAKGSYGDSSRDRNFIDATYNYTATSPKISGVISPDTDFIPLTIEEYQALDLKNIAA